MTAATMPDRPDDEREAEVVPLHRPARASAPTATAGRPDDARDEPPRISDEALVAACALGDSDALGALFDQHHAALRAFLERMTRRDPAEVDDLVQATFLTVWHAAGRFHGSSAVRTWIFAIGANLVRRRSRTEGRRRAAHAALAAAPTSPPGRRPDDATIQAQLVERLADAVAALPADLREVFVLCEIEDVPGTEVARALELRPGTVWRRLHDARRRLRAALDGGTP